MKSCVIILLLISVVILHVSSGPTPDVCLKLKCKKDQVCDRKAIECVNKEDMTEGRPCEKHEDCRDDHICYAGKCILFHGRH